MIGVLFDLDGVLVDSEGLYTEFWGQIGEKYPTGYDDFAYRIKGSNLERILNTYFPDKELQTEIVKLIDDYEENMRYDLFPHVISFLDELQANNIPMAVVTSSSSIKMERVYKQHPDFKKYFKAIVTGDMIKHSKPDPECFKLGAKLINCEPESCYVFEDSISGIKAGLASGSKVIALATTLKRDQLDFNVEKIIDGFESFSIKEMLSI